MKKICNSKVILLLLWVFAIIFLLSSIQKRTKLANMQVEAKRNMQITEDCAPDYIKNDYLASKLNQEDSVIKDKSTLILDSAKEIETEIKASEIEASVYEPETKESVVESNESLVETNEEVFNDNSISFDESGTEKLATIKEIAAEESRKRAEDISKRNDSSKIAIPDANYQKASDVVFAQDGSLIIVGENGDQRVINFSLIDDDLEQLLLPRKSEVNLLEFDDGYDTMPTVANYTGTSDAIRDKIAGTDKWNELIYKVATEENVDPVYVKCIMAQESAGNQKAVNKANKNKTGDWGLMQVNDSWGEKYDYDRMLEDPEYAIWCGIDVLKLKKSYAQQFDKQGTIFNVSWFYNGYSDDGKKYAQKVAKIYEGLTGKDATTTYFDID